MDVGCRGDLEEKPLHPAIAPFSSFSVFPGFSFHFSFRSWTLNVNGSMTGGLGGYKGHGGSPCPISLGTKKIYFPHTLCLAAQARYTYVQVTDLLKTETREGSR